MSIRIYERFSSTTFDSISSHQWGESDARRGVGGGEVSVISCHILTHFDTFAAHFATLNVSAISL